MSNHHKVVFTADMHGNEFQYKKLVDYAVEISADSIIIGGDVAPNNFHMDSYIKGQRNFLSRRLPQLLGPLEEALPNSRVFLMMGNDDCSANLEVLEGYDPMFFRLIHGKRIKIADTLDIVGCSFVPITPFEMKDWEKYDLSEVPKDLAESHVQRMRADYEFSGYKSTRFGWEEFWFNPEMQGIDSIQRFLSADLFCENAGNTVCVFHTAPNNTNLDLSYNGHIGSLAIRQFIEEHQPYLTLHGHVHETVELSHDYKQQMGKTLSLGAGNESRFELALLAFDLYRPNEAVREVI